MEEAAAPPVSWSDRLSCSRCHCKARYRDIEHEDTLVSHVSDDSPLWIEQNISSDEPATASNHGSDGDFRTSSGNVRQRSKQSSSGKQLSSGSLQVPEAAAKFTSERSNRSRSSLHSSGSARGRRKKTQQLQAEDLQLSKGLSDLLGITSPEESVVESPPANEGLGSQMMRGLSKRFSSLGLDGSAFKSYEEPRTSQTKEEPANLNTSMATDESPTQKGGVLQNLLFAANMKSRITTFRKSMVAVPMADQREKDRGIQIEGVYDFWAFEAQTVRVRKMNESVFHHRRKQESDDESRDSGSSSSKGSDSGSSTSSKGKSKKTRNDKRVSIKDKEDIARAPGTEPEGGGDKKNARRKGKKFDMDRLKNLSSNPLNVDACAHWGVVVGKVLRLRVQDFTGIVDKAGQHLFTNKFQNSASAKGTILNSVRERALQAAKQAHEMAKRIAKEPMDCFDWQWDEPDILEQLFGTEYFDTLALFANTARKILSAQTTLVKATVPCRIFGDTHGQLRDVLLLFKAFGGPDEHAAPMFVFNGDFVDRGSHQLELIGLLLAFKVLLPERVWLIRGNHEDRQMNKRYGFLDDCKQKLGSTLGPKVFDLIQSAFDMLPVACIIGERILVVHGGIGHGMWQVGDVRKVKRPISDDDLKEGLINDILWSDPIEDDDAQLGAVFGVHDSPRGAQASTFAWNVTQTFCARNGLSLVVRSHQSKQSSPGFDIMHESLLMRVFSARDYEGHGNDGAVLLVSQSLDSGVQDVLKVRPQVLRSTTKAHIEEDARANTTSDHDAHRRRSRPAKGKRRNSKGH